MPLDFDPLLLGRWPLLIAGTVLLIWLWLPKSPVKPLELAREVAVVLSAFLFYFIVRANVDHRQFEALQRGADLIRMERALGIFWEVEIQQRVLYSEPLLHLANWTYEWLHWPVIVFVGMWLYLLHRTEYSTYRNAFLISGAIGLVIYGALPTAPPRFLEGWGFVDTIAIREGAQQVQLPPQLLNEYAALPSLHFGWNLLAGIALARHATNPLFKLLGVIMPIAMFLAIVSTGNHYIIDGLAGAMVALIALMAAILLQDFFDRRGERIRNRLPAFATRLV